MLLHRWARPQGRLTTLDEVGERFGITRERVRQITTKHELALARSNLRLPLLSRLVAILDDIGGVAPSADLISRAAAEGIPVSQHVLDLLEALGEIGLVPPVRYEPKYRLWVTPRRATDWRFGGGLGGEIQRAIRRVRQHIRRDGAAPVSVLTGASLRVEDAVAVLSSRGHQFQVQDDYIVPVPTIPCVLTRAIERMACVTPDLALDELRAGLEQVFVQRRGCRVYLDVPPTSVLETIIAHHRRVLRTPSGVRVASPEDCQRLLTQAERVVVEEIQRKEGIALGSDLIDAVKAAGYSQALAAYVLRQPFIVRRGTALYGLRGHSVEPTVMRARLRDRAAARRKSVRSVSYTGGPIARVVYELTAFSIQGVLPVPSRLPDLSHIPWTARVPGGRQFRVRVKNHLLWPLRKWFTAEQVALGDLIVATFYLPEAVIEFDKAS